MPFSLNKKHRIARFNNESKVLFWLTLNVHINFNSVKWKLLEVRVANKRRKSKSAGIVFTVRYIRNYLSSLITTRDE